MEFQNISSIKDPHVAKARSLHSLQNRKKEGAILLLGKQVIQWAIKSKLSIEYIFASDKIDKKEYESILHASNTWFLTPESILKKITETKHTIPLVGVAKTEPTFNTDAAFFVVLDHVKDHGNIGAICRSSKAFGVENVVSIGTENDLFYKKSIDASRGAVFSMQHLHFDETKDAINWLKENNIQVVVTSPHAKQLQSKVNLQKKPIALILGNETVGVSDEITKQADVAIQIPLIGDVESLNVAVAAGISIYELQTRMVLTMLQKNIKSTLGREMGVTAQLIRKTFDVELKKCSPLSAKQVVLLMILSCDKTTSLQQASIDIGHPLNKMPQLVDQLIIKGYIKIANDTIEITPHGQQEVALLWPLIQKAEQSVLDGFSKNEEKQLFNFLKRIQENCLKITT